MLELANWPIAGPDAAEQAVEFSMAAMSICFKMAIHHP